MKKRLKHWCSSCNRDYAPTIIMEIQQFERYSRVRFSPGYTSKQEAETSRWFSYLPE